MKTEYTPIIEKGFTNKAEYLAWRNAWRKHYALLTTEIREEKKRRKSPDASERGSAQYTCWRYRQEATRLLELRKQSKVEAQRQYLATKVTAASAV